MYLLHPKHWGNMAGKGQKVFYLFFFFLKIVIFTVCSYYDSNIIGRDKANIGRMSKSPYTHKCEGEHSDLLWNNKLMYFYHSLYRLHINRVESRYVGGVRRGTHTAYHQTLSHNLPKPQKNK